MYSPCPYACLTSAGEHSNLGRTSIRNADGLSLIYIVMQAGSLQPGSPLLSQAPAERSGYPETPAPSPAAMSLYSQEHAPAHQKGLGHGGTAGIAGQVTHLRCMAASNSPSFCISACSLNGGCIMLNSFISENRRMPWRFNAPELTQCCHVCSRRGHSSRSYCCCRAHMLSEAAGCQQIPARVPTRQAKHGRAAHHSAAPCLQAGNTYRSE